jgi:hypothetical protein
MDEELPESWEILLARINSRLERISEAQHRLACERALLREQATRLRLGVSAAEVRVVLLRAGIGGAAIEPRAERDGIVAAA